MSTTLTEGQAARQIWLLYFNRTLLEQGVITEKEYSQMKIKIQSGPKTDPAPCPSVDHRPRFAPGGPPSRR